MRRVQTVIRHPYAEIRDNLIADTCRPIDMLRCKLAFFGASKFDPKSDRWTRIALADVAEVKVVDGPPVIKSENARLNGWTQQMMDAIRAGINAAARDEETRVLVLTGQPGSSWPLARLLKAWTRPSSVGSSSSS